MKQIFSTIENSGISIDEYTEDGKLCGYELNTYTDGGVNQIIFVDFRDTGKDPKNESDFISLLSARINSIDIDTELELNRQDKLYRHNFSIAQGHEDFKNWKNGLLELVSSLTNAAPTPSANELEADEMQRAIGDETVGNERDEGGKLIDFEIARNTTSLFIRALLARNLPFSVEYSRGSESVYLTIPNKDHSTGFIDPEFRISCHYANFENEYNELIVNQDNYVAKTLQFVKKIFE